MTSKEILDTSITFGLGKHFWLWWQRLSQRSIYISQNSQTSRWTKQFCKKLRVSFKYSFLGRITELKQEDSKIINNSWVVQGLVSFYNSWKGKTLRKLENSVIINLAKDTKRELYFSPILIISIILTIAIATNIFLSLFLKKHIGLWGWLVWGLFLFLSICGLNCRAEWPTVKRNSIFLRKVIGI